MKRLLASLMLVSLVIVFSSNVFASEDYETIETVTLTVESRGLPLLNGEYQEVSASGDYYLYRNDLTYEDGPLNTDTDWQWSFQMVVSYNSQTHVYTYEFPNWQSELDPTYYWWGPYDSNTYSYYSSIMNRTHRHIFEHVQ